MKGLVVSGRGGGDSDVKMLNFCQGRPSGLVSPCFPAVVLL